MLEAIKLKAEVQWDYDRNLDKKWEATEVIFKRHLINKIGRT